jgi:TonB C terminal
VPQVSTTTCNSQRVRPELERLTPALLLSLLLHALLLTLTFAGQGRWLPGFAFPWQDRRIEAPDLRVIVLPPQVKAESAVAPAEEPVQHAWVEPPIASGPAPTPSARRAPTRRRTATAIAPGASPSASASSAATHAATSEPPSQTPLHADRPADTAPSPIQAPAVIALSPPDEATWVVPTTPAPATPVTATAQSVAKPKTAKWSLADAGDKPRTRIRKEGAAARSVAPTPLDLAKQESQRQAEELEASHNQAARAESARLEAERDEVARMAADLQETARQAAARQETERKVAAGIEAARVEAARVETARVETARVETARVETARVEAARVEAARVEAARVEAERAEAARAEAARAEAAKVEATRVEATRVEAAQDATAKREAKLRAIGRQLDEEAAQREGAIAAARQSPSPPPSWRSARRYRLLGRTDPNAELILYAEDWARKIQLNTTIDMVREAAKHPHTDPLVMVAIRSDGSVESVTFVQSSGVPALDEAIRRVVLSQTPYQAFPPGLARDFDVIEIRRTWAFDVAIRLY